VTALNVVGRYLYIGNTRGRIMVAEAATLRPLCIFPAHSPREFYVKCLLPILGPQEEGLVQDAGEVTTSSSTSPALGIVSLGRGCVDLLSQEGNVTVRKMSTLSSGASSSGSSGGGERKGRERAATVTDGYAHHTFLLSWSAENWEYY
jgi:hypothetical protein